MSRDGLTRRQTLKGLTATGVLLGVGCEASSSAPEKGSAAMAKDPVLHSVPLPESPVPLPTRDPFLFCVHHDDRYPKGNAQFGPAVPLHGRQMGQDFSGRDGFSMYHGDVVPGFPRHPHRGFETVTVVRQGLLDHADSMGAAARYGRGDVQWLTAGGGIQHSEMFPLLKAEADNPVELFQIWLNLPAKSKMVAPHFSMLWAPAIPTHDLKDDQGKALQVTTFAGNLDGAEPPPPPPDSWASQPGSEVAIWSIKLSPGASFALPAVGEQVERSLYVLDGEGLTLDGHAHPPRTRLDLVRQDAVTLRAGDKATEVLLLQGKPIGEPVAHYGPFVMNTRAELQQAVADYQATQFGGWPWPAADPVHGGEGLRFARHADGRVERPA